MKSANRAVFLFFLFFTSLAHTSVPAQSAAVQQVIQQPAQSQSVTEQLVQSQTVQSVPVPMEQGALQPVQANTVPSSNVQVTQQRVVLGVENISPEFLKSLTSKGDLSYTVGLVTNQTGKNQAGVRTLDVLLKKGVKVVALFAPEHGIDGKIWMENDVHDSTDASAKVTVYSLYKDGRPRKISKEQIQNIDVLIFDMQDAGMRHYTYVTTMFEMLEAAAEFNKIAVVLDRPNYLGGVMEGPLVDPVLKSAISYAPIPLRHGMTVGELALYFNQKILQKPVTLHVVPMKNYERRGHSTHGLLTYLSPNIATVPACYGYSFLGLVGEVNPFEIGISTDKAFQCILLPDKLNFPKTKWPELQAILKEQGIESSFYQAQSVARKVPCSGLRISITDINQFSSMTTLLRILDFFKKEKVALSFKLPAFDKAIGTSKVRLFFEGSADKNELFAQINKDLDQFYEAAEQLKCFLYQPYPTVIHVQ